MVYTVHVFRSNRERQTTSLLIKLQRELLPKEFLFPFSESSCDIYLFDTRVSCATLALKVQRSRA